MTPDPGAGLPPEEKERREEGKERRPDQRKNKECWFQHCNKPRHGRGRPRAQHLGKAPNMERHRGEAGGSGAPIIILRGACFGQWSACACIRGVCRALFRPAASMQSRRVATTPEPRACGAVRSASIPGTETRDEGGKKFTIFKSFSFFNH